MNSSVVVSTTSGRLRGTHEGAVVTFRGVPYAQPPTGEKRWAPAESVRKWAGIRDAFTDGPVCWQPTAGPVVDLMGDQVGAHPMSEDCLSLTIWTSGVEVARRPVLVWIHGGGFVAGAGSWDIYSGSKLALHGAMVVIALNYRLGPFGYLRAGTEDRTDGNLWLSDQRCALNWIQQNVEAFGGDPERVILGGQSGGAWSIMALLGLDEPPRAGGAVLMSAPSSLKPRTVSESAAFTDRLQASLAIERREDLLGLDGGQLLAGAVTLLPELRRFATVTPPFMPTEAEPEVPLDVAGRFAARAKDLDVMIGWTTAEMGFFLPATPDIASVGRDQVIERMREKFGERAEVAYDVYSAEFDSPYQVLEQYTSDELFKAGAEQLAEQLADAGNRVWTYEFDVQSGAFGGLAGAAHCIDLPFAFDLLDEWELSGGALLRGMNTAANQAIVSALHNSLISFVRGEEPRVSGVSWRHGSPADVGTVRIGSRRIETVLPGPISDLWRQHRS